MPISKRKVLSNLHFRRTAALLTGLLMLAALPAAAWADEGETQTSRGPAVGATENIEERDIIHGTFEIDRENMTPFYSTAADAAQWAMTSGKISPEEIYAAVAGEGNDNPDLKSSRTASWNTAFAAWCLAQMGYTEYGYSIETVKPFEFYRFMVRNNPYCSGSGVEADKIVPGTVVFRSDKAMGKFAAIVKSYDGDKLTVYAGSAAGNICEITYNRVPDDLLFVIPETAETEFSILSFVLRETGMGRQAALGVLGNLWYESEYDPEAVGDGGQTYGICEWYGGRQENLKTFCQTNGFDYRTLESQLRFMTFELEQNYTDLMAMMNAEGDNLYGISMATRDFCLEYERPLEAEYVGDERGWVTAYEYLAPLIFNSHAQTPAFG